MYAPVHCLLIVLCGDVMYALPMLSTGKYAMQQLISKLPAERREPNEFVVSDETVCAVEATIYEVIKSNQEHARYVT